MAEPKKIEFERTISIHSNPEYFFVIIPDEFQKYMANRTEAQDNEKAKIIIEFK